MSGTDIAHGATCDTRTKKREYAMPGTEEAPGEWFYDRDANELFIMVEGDTPPAPGTVRSKPLTRVAGHFVPGMLLNAFDSDAVPLPRSSFREAEARGSRRTAHADPRPRRIQRQSSRLSPPRRDRARAPSCASISNVHAQSFAACRLSVVARWCFLGVTLRHSASTFLRPYRAPNGGDYSYHHGAMVMLE
eukprot:135530-Rhodomonas_salina.1